ncbi:MAG: A/G-specific adenine glycosylase [Gemmatimonadota bacterium]|nr:A/G-specific adenine glycosylase [Gemmatimonadota bacterium]
MNASDQNKTYELADEDVARYRRSLLTWYQEHKRDLLWRHSNDPYSVWISEMMLQQTQVTQAEPYYERFMAQFPSVETLAGATLDDVLKAWEGLGYYARARYLHRAAVRVVDQYGGRIPESMSEISILPGIGPYTAAAILSIAYHRDHAAVDGNVIRVLSRLYRIHEDATRGPAKRRFQKLADGLLQKGQAADFNQAMMELGATVCLPQKPSCTVCPVQCHCRAFHELSDPSLLPYKPPKKERPHHDHVAGVIKLDDKFLIIQRPLDGLLGGLWEFPGGRRRESESLTEAVTRTILESTGLTVKTDLALPTVTHAFTHFKITLYGFCCTFIKGAAEALTCHDARWVSPTQLADFAFSRAHNRLIDIMKKEAAKGQVEMFVSAAK